MSQYQLKPGDYLMLSDSLDDIGRTIERIEAGQTTLDGTGPVMPLPSGVMPCHSARVVADPSGNLFVAEMTAPEFVITPVAEWMASNITTDSVWVLPLSEPLNGDQITDLWNWACDREGDLYDVLLLAEMAVTRRPAFYHHGVCSTSVALSMIVTNQPFSCPPQWYTPADLMALPYWQQPPILYQALSADVATTRLRSRKQ